MACQLTYELLKSALKYLLKACQKQSWKWETVKHSYINTWSQNIKKFVFKNLK